MYKTTVAAVTSGFSVTNTFCRRPSAFLFALIVGELLHAVQPRLSSSLTNKQHDTRRVVADDPHPAGEFSSPERNYRPQLSSGMQCYSFTVPPQRTYCLLPGPAGPLNISDTLDQCTARAMRLPNSDSAPVERLQTVMRLFQIERYGLLLSAEWFNDFVLFSWDQCSQPIQSTKLSIGAACKLCNIAAVCETAAYSFDLSNCVTVQAAADEIEYCYYSEGVAAQDATASCRNRSATLVFLLRNDVPLTYIKPLLFSKDKFWLRIKQEDVDGLEAVITFNISDIDGSSCFIVHSNPTVLWVFKRNCSDTYSVFCARKRPQQEKNSARLSNCPRQHRWHTYDICADDRLIYNFTDALNFCKEHSMKLLEGSMLREIFRPIMPVRPEFIWDAISYFRGPDPESCLAGSVLNLFRAFVNCSERLPYLCVQKKTENPSPSGQSDGLYCENVDKTARNVSSKCFNRQGLSMQQSVEACEELGMYLLPEGLQDLEYEQLTDELQNETQESGASRLWLHSLRNCNGSCVALEHVNGTFLQHRINCSEKLPSVCLYPPAIFPLPALGKCNGSDQCSDDVELYCPSEKIRQEWELLENSSDIEAISERLHALENDVAYPGDIKTICNRVQQVLNKFDELTSMLSDDEKAKEKKKLAEALVRLTSKVMLMTNLWRCFTQNDRLDLAAELFIKVERFAWRRSTNALLRGDRK